MSFFFSDKKRKPIARRAAPAKPAQAGKASKEMLNRNGCKVCPLNSAKNFHPKMEPDLAPEQGGIYFLGEGVSDESDEKNTPFVGRSGILLRDCIGNNDAFSFDNVVRDYDNVRAQPAWVSMECCRGHVTRSIELAKPKLIVGLGIAPLQWMLNSSDMIGLRGRVFAVKVGQHSCWFMPSYHPQFIIDNAYEGKDPLRSKLGHCLKFDMKRAIKLWRDLPEAQIDTPQAARAGVQAFNGRGAGQLAQVLALISEARKAPVKAIDWETYPLRPYAADAKLLTAAVSFKSTNFAFAVDHPKGGWKPHEKEAIKKAMRELLSDKTKIVAHNCFGGDTEFITDKGFRKFKDVSGTKVNVWTEQGWQRATVNSYGKQKLMNLELVPFNRSTSSIRHNIEVTKEHNWLVERKVWSKDTGYQWQRVSGFIETQHLKLKDKIIAASPNARKPDLYSSGFVHGLIFADGSLIKKRVKENHFPHNIRLCGEKAKYSDRFKKVSYPKHAGGDPVCNWHVSPYSMKEMPTEKMGIDYIQDFIEGWQRLDGSDAPGANARIVSTVNEEAANWLRKYASLAGWYVTGFLKKTHKSQWASTGSSHCWHITITKHADMAWTVKSITETSKIEEVYCASVPGIRAFTLGPGIYTGNCPFEVEWAIGWLGREAIFHDVWECTMMQAHFLDERRGKRGGNDEQFQPNPYQALDFLVRQYFGISFKELFKVNRKRMDQADLDETLLYNGADTKYTLRLFDLQMEHLRLNGLLGAYKEARSRQPAVALMQSMGISLSQEVNKEFSVKFGNEIEIIEKRIRTMPEVKDFINKYQTFNVGSQPEVIRLLKENFKVGNVLINAEGKESVDKSALQRIDHPIAKDIEEWRKFSKLKSTYVDPYTLGSGEFIWPDGKIHPNFNTTFAETGRTSSSSPNQQNWTNRDKESRSVRKQLIAPKGYVLVAFDYGQLEGCTGAMCSRDKTFVKALWEDYDMHMVWAKRAAALWPAYVGGEHMRSDKDTMKAFRSLIKNKLVFPAFFGAAQESIAGYLTVATGTEAPKHIIEKLFNEFWRDFSGFANWQKRLMNDYYNTGFVESPTGRRRHYPLGRPQAINYPIQSVACDIVCRAMVKLSADAADTGNWYLHSTMNIHDDLTFCIPDDPKILEPAIEHIYRTMLSPGFDFINVPLSVSCSIGNNWLEMDDVGRFWSHKDL